MVEHGRLGGPRAAGVVVRGDGVHDLGEGVGLEASARSSIRRTPSVRDRATSLRRSEGRRPAVELAGSPYVVEKRRSEQDVGSQACMKLRGLTAEGGTATVCSRTPVHEW